MGFYKFLVCFLVLGAVMPSLAYAQKKKASPIEITAAGSLEWDRNKKLYIARQDAKAVRDNSVIQANQLIAYYTEPKEGDMQITRFEATGNVRISLNNGEQKVFGDKAVYNMKEEKAVITGKNLKLVTPEQIVTAQESLEYWAPQKRMLARGNATATQDDDKLEAQTISAFLRTNAKGDDEIYRLEADNNVVITTPTEVAKGKKGTYNLDKNEAELTGGVTILRGPNTLLGERATVDLNTNISKIFGGEQSPAGNGRVRAVFYPEKLEQTNQSVDTE